MCIYVTKMDVFMLGLELEQPNLLAQVAKTIIYEDSTGFDSEPKSYCLARCCPGSNFLFKIPGSVESVYTFGLQVSSTDYFHY